MRHNVYGRKLGRKTNHRIAMWRNMAVSLFTHGQITTTVPKAKSLRPFVEKLITAAKKGDLASRRRVIAALGGDKPMIVEEDHPDVERNKYGEIIKSPKVVKHLFDEIAPKYADRSGGYTRIIRLGTHRVGDGSDLCVIQLISEEDTGPQVAGQHSRRREKANRRMERAAALRKGAAAAASSSGPEAPTAVADPEEPEVDAELEEGSPTEPEAADAEPSPKDES